MLPAFSQNVEPTTKRYLLAVDVSGSMGWGNCCGTTSITPRVASAAMAMVTARTEQAFEFVGFSHELVPIPIISTMKLDDVLHTISAVCIHAQVLLINLFSVKFYKLRFKSYWQPLTVVR